MNCREARKVVHLFVDGALDPRENVDVLAHLNMCSSCNDRFGEARRFEDLLKEKLKAEPAPEGVKARLNAHLSEMAAPWPVRLAASIRRKPVAGVLGLAAVVALAFGVWHEYGEFTTCPFVVSATKLYFNSKSAQVMPQKPEGPLKLVNDSAGVVRQLGDMVHTERLVGDVNGQIAVGDIYRMPNCPNDKHCIILFLVPALALTLNDHQCVVRDGRKYSCWQYNDCHIVCWKEPKSGLYCLMVCSKTEMDADALVNYADIAATR